MCIDKGFVVSRDTPHHLRVYMSEGSRLPGNPDRFQLRKACIIGARGGNTRSGRRVKCPSRIGPRGKRWTTLEAWLGYDDQLNGDA